MIVPLWCTVSLEVCTLFRYSSVSFSLRSHCIIDGKTMNLLDGGGRTSQVLHLMPYQKSIIYLRCNNTILYGEQRVEVASTQVTFNISIVLT